MIKTAIVKPDHLGDFILATPAMRAVLAEFPETTIYCSPQSAFLKRHFFPDATERIISLAYLSKQRQGVPLEALASELSSYDVVFFLRSDGAMQALSGQLRSFAVVPYDDLETHETLLQKRAVERLIPRYSRTDLFSQRDRIWPKQISVAGLCISAGFFSNKWPLAYWRELGLTLLERGVEKILLLGGGAEKTDLGILAASLPSTKTRTLIGDSNVGQFLREVSDCDVVIGSDSGTLHICSCAVPTLGIFTSSPWRRYAPFGRHNRVITLDLECSPCVQFSTNTINACLSRECGVMLKPTIVADALAIGWGQPEARAFASTTIVDGASHLDET